MIKNLLLSKPIKNLLNNELKFIGKILDLSYNSNDKSISLTVKLKGEPDILRGKILNYEVIHKDEYYFILKKYSASKPWINGLIDKLLINKKFPIPKKIALFLTYLKK